MEPSRAWKRCIGGAALDAAARDNDLSIPEPAPVAGGGSGAVSGGAAPSGEGLGVAPVLRNQVLASREHQSAREGQEERFGNPGAEPFDEQPALLT